MAEESKPSSWKDPEIWGRAALAVAFLLLLALLVGPLVIVLGVVQAVFTIATGEDNRNLRDLGAALTEYVREILLFATWNQERRPFPLSGFPRVDGEAGDEVAAADAATESETGNADKDSAESESGSESAASEASRGDGDAEEAGGEPAEAEKPAKKGARKKSLGKKAAAGDSKDEG